MSKRRKLSKGRSRGKAKPVTLPGTPSQWDRGADGPANMDRLRTEPATDIDPETGRETPNPNGVLRQRRHSWVRIYGEKGGLTPEQVAAAERLLMAAEGMRERDPLAALSGVRSRGDFDPQAARVDARRYFREQWAKLPTACRPVVQRVVLNDLPIWHGNPSTRERHMQRLRNGLSAIA
ncbi:hypothetical protein [Pseudogemmobacter sonorensis]|uniref:hypothetical protein n=1 Tax=Pseudogemmobacter sonorensis TaxID=2989681 RepID=UPI00369933FA